MPIKGWTHPTMGYRIEDLFADEIVRIIPKPVLWSMLNKENNDKRHEGMKLTTTSPMGCVRAFALSRTQDTYPNPQKMVPAHMGTIIHEHLGITAGNFSQEYVTEEMDPEACTVRGKLWGREMSGLLDMRTLDWAEIHDWKISMKEANKWVSPDRKCSPHQAIQMNINRMLAEQQHQLDLRDCEMNVWVMSARIERTYADYMTLDEIWDTQIMNTKYTQEPLTFGEQWDKLCEFIDFYNACDDEEELLKYIAALPWDGKRMFNSRKGEYSCLSACALKGDCDLMSGGL